MIKMRTRRLLKSFGYLFCRLLNSYVHCFQQTKMQIQISVLYCEVFGDTNFINGETSIKFQTVRVFALNFLPLTSGQLISEREIRGEIQWRSNI